MIAERRADMTSADVSHTRHLVVAHAPALFEIPCTDPSCRDGGHDITTQLLHGFRQHLAEFDGDDVCNGSIGATHCGRVLSFTAFAQYSSPK